MTQRDNNISYQIYFILTDVSQDQVQEDKQIRQINEDHLLIKEEPLPGYDSVERAPDQVGAFDDSREAPPTVSSRRSLPVTILVLGVVGLLCADSMFPEDVAMNWSSLLLSRSRSEERR